MKDIIIIGSGGYGKEVKTVIDAINKISPTWNVTAFYDDAFTGNVAIIDGINCLGTIDDLISLNHEDLNLVFGIADRNVVNNVVDKFKNNNTIKFPNIIHPTVEINSGVVLGKGNVIVFGCFLSCDVILGDFNFFNTFVSIGHDTIIGNFNCLMPRTQISGYTVIGNHNFFGMNSALLQNKKIGNNNIINSYTFLTKNITNDRKYFGVPGKRIFN